MTLAAWALLSIVALTTPATTWGHLSPATSPALDQRGTEECKSDKPKTRWVSTVLSQALEDFVPSGEFPLSPCTKDGKIYAENLANLTYWATKMYDASSKGISPGILEGRNYEFGHFDECTSASSKHHGISGKYVLAEFKFEPSVELYPDFQLKKKEFQIPPEEASAWEAVKPSLDRRVEDRNAVRWALCVPHSCTDRDVEAALQRTLYPALQAHRILGNLTVLSAYSYTRADSRLPPSKAYYTFLCITVIFIALVTASTIYDVNNIFGKDNERPWILCFSLKKNFGDLCEIPNNEFSVMSGLKVISMILVIYGHRMMISISTPQFNPNNIQLTTGNYWSSVLDNGHLVVNTFMTITGFLTFYKITKDLNNNKDLSVIGNIYNRFMRLTPAYLFTQAFQYFFFPYYEGGPMSRTVVWDSQVFGKYWWTHITYLNNYIKPGYQSLIPSWYIALDMQMYIFAYLLGGLLQKMKSLTPHVLSLSAILSLALPAATVAYTHYWGTYRLFYTRVMDHFRDPEFQALYMPTHTRCAPYVIGMLGGFIYYHIKEKKVTFQKKTLWLLAFLTAGVFHLSLFWPYRFYIPGRDYVLWENVAYASLHRLGWGTAVVWIIISSTIGNFSLFKKIFGLAVYEPLNRLNYAALLVHGPVQIYMIGHIRAPVNYGRIMGIWMACGDVCFTYLISMVLYCLVEGPFALIQKKIWDRYISNVHPKPLKK